MLIFIINSIFMILINIFFWFLFFVIFVYFIIIVISNEVSINGIIGKSK